MSNLKKLEIELKELNKRNIIYIICIIIGIGLFIGGVMIKVPSLNGALALIGFATIITFGILKSKNTNKILKLKIEIYDIQTISKAIEDSKK